jgi:transcriptional regulator with XRE-family HTH domain
MFYFKRRQFYSVKEQVAERIRLESLRLNLSQQNIADELGITVAAYSNLERGVTEISINRLFKIAELLKVPVSVFLTVETENNIPKIDTSNSSISDKYISQQLYLVIQEVKHLTDEMKKMKEQIESLSKKKHK